MALTCNNGRKGFVYTLEAVIASILLLTTVTVIIPDLESQKRTDNEVKQRVLSGIEVLDSTGQLEDNLSIEALETDLKPFIPDGYSYKVLLKKVDTREIEFDIDSLKATVYGTRAGTYTQAEWNQGRFNDSTADRDNNSGDLGLGYRNTSDGLVGHWRMDRTSGNVTDYSDNGLNGTNNDTQRGVEGVFSTNSFWFNSSNNESVKLGNREELDFAGEKKFTVSAWARWDGNRSGGRKDMVHLGEYSIVLFSGTADGWSIYFESPGNTPHSVATGTAMPQNEWMHVAGTYNGSQLKLYVNGEQKASSSVTAEVEDQSAVDDGIGIHANKNDRPWPGNIDEVRIYNRSLSSSEIKQLYFNGQKGSFTGNYSRNYTLPVKEVPKKIEVDSQNIDSSGNVSWAVVSTDKGEKAEIKLDPGSNDRNYSLGFTQEAAEVKVHFNFSVDNDTAVKSPVIDDFRLWVNDSAERSYYLDRDGSTSVQIFFNDSSNANVSFGRDYLVTDHSGGGYEYADLSSSQGYLKFFGTSEGLAEVDNSSIEGDEEERSSVESVNYVITKNGLKEVKVLLWQ